jgi:ATP-dependent exoDNAse (exonuclease V) beta subunit
MSLIVLKASAGSGKTFQLAKRFLHLVLTAENEDTFKSILAITFTNKAAQEMKDRIVFTLQQFATSGELEDREAVLMKQLNDETNLNETEIRSRSKSVLFSLLHHYGDFSVSTIDSFTHRLVKSFSFDLKIPSNFKVELDVNSLLTMAVNELLFEIGNNNSLPTKILEDFVEKQIDNEKSWNINNLLVEFAKPLLRDNNNREVASLEDIELDVFKKMVEKHQKECELIKKKIIELAEEGLTFIHENNLEEHVSRGTLTKRLTAFKKADFDTIWDDEPGFYENPEKWFKKSLEKKVPDSDSITAKAHSYIESIMEHFNQYSYHNIIANEVFKTGTLSLVGEHLEMLKKQLNTLHISDFNKSIGDVVQSEPAPFIYERLGEHYWHYMLDEFQDTSIIQWHNLIPLFGNALSQGGSSLIVGDAKQAIYRFRGGEARQFVALPELYNPYSDQAIAEWQAPFLNVQDTNPLDHNFRSWKNIVAFNNQFFTRARDILSEDHRKMYDDVEQTPFHQDNSGFVSFTLHKYEKNNELGLNSHEFKKWAKEENENSVIELIQDLTKNGLYKPFEIMILVRSGQDSNKIASILKNNNIDVHSERSTILGNTPEFRLAISFFNLLLSPTENYYRVEFLLAANNLNLLAESLSNYLTRSFLSTKYDTFLQKTLNSTFNINSKNSIAENFEEFISKLPGNEKNAAFLALSEFIQSFTDKNGNNLTNFINELESKKEKINVETQPHENAVQIMTMHKSKGLQSAVVICPYLDNNLKKIETEWVENNEAELPFMQIKLSGNQVKYTQFKDDQELKEQEEIVDTLNLLYVAFTRAEEQLYGFSSEATESKTGGLIREHVPQFTESDDDVTFTYGTPVSQREKKSKEKVNTMPGHSFYFYDHKKDLKVSRPKVQYSQVSEKTASQLGAITHEILEKANGQNQLKELISQMSEIHRLNETEIKLIESWIDNVLQSDYSDAILSPNTLSERSLYVPASKSTYRPDKVALTENNRVQLFDFKTGGRTFEHQEQLSNYASVINEMGIEVDKTVLCYLDENDFVEL